MTKARTDRDDQGNTKPVEPAGSKPAKPILKPLPDTPRLPQGVLPPVTPVPDETVPATAPVKHPVKPADAVPTLGQQTALSVTKEIQENLLILKKAFLRVVLLLGQVRNEKLYAELGYATIEAYAAAQLSIKSTVLKSYLRVYAWMQKVHPAWLKPGAKLKLADLDDAESLIWIEDQLARENLPAARKAGLQDLQKKALDGTLLRTEVRDFKAKGDMIERGNRAFLSNLRSLHKRGVAMASLPEGVIGFLEGAIDLLQRTVAERKKTAKSKAPKRPAAPK